MDAAENPISIFFIVYMLVLLITLLLSIGLPIFCGVFVYSDARKRNMDAVLWTLLAVLTSGIGLIIYLVVRNKPASAACPACAQPVEPGWQLCPRCGSQLPEASPAD